jgi:hypothetical protein
VEQMVQRILGHAPHLMGLLMVPRLRPVVVMAPPRRAPALHPLRFARR